MLNTPPLTLEMLIFLPSVDSELYLVHVDILFATFTSYASYDQIKFKRGEESI